MSTSAKLASFGIPCPICRVVFLFAHFQEIVLWRKAPEKLRKRNFHQRYESPEPQTQPVNAEQPEMWVHRYELKPARHTPTPHCWTARGVKAGDIWKQEYTQPLAITPSSHPPITAETHPHTDANIIQVGWIRNFKLKATRKKERWGCLIEPGIRNMKPYNLNVKRRCLGANDQQCISAWNPFSHCSIRMMLLVSDSVLLDVWWSAWLQTRGAQLWLSVHAV